MTRMQSAVHVEPDHWEPDNGVLGLHFDGAAGNNTTTVIRLTEDDLDQVALAIRDHRLKTGARSYSIIEVPAQSAGGLPARD
jgi:hypothetical protein